MSKNDAAHSVLVLAARQPDFKQEVAIPMLQDKLHVKDLCMTAFRQYSLEHECAKTKQNYA